MVICSQADHCRVPTCPHRCTHKLDDECISSSCINAAIPVKCIIIELFDQGPVSKGLFFKDYKK